MKNILVYDLGTMPKRATLREIVKAYKENGVIMWCSAAHSNFAGRNIETPPQVVDKDDTNEFRFIDTAGLTAEQIKEILK